MFALFIGVRSNLAAVFMTVVQTTSPELIFGETSVRKTNIMILHSFGVAADLNTNFSYRSDLKVTEIRVKNSLRVQENLDFLEQVVA